jgi:hypothetical protein
MEVEGLKSLFLGENSGNMATTCNYRAEIALVLTKYHCKPGIDDLNLSGVKRRALSASSANPD